MNFEDVTEEIKQIFLDRIERGNKRDCWNWPGIITKDGYGCFKRRGKSYPAHRVSAVVFNVPILEGFLILHKCHNRKCINPHHLYCGTNKQNSWDMIRAGRHALANVVEHFLTDEDKAKIISLHLKGVKTRDIGPMFKTSKRNVFKVIRIYRRTNGLGVVKPLISDEEKRIIADMVRSKSVDDIAKHYKRHPCMIRAYIKWAREHPEQTA